MAPGRRQPGEGPASATRGNSQRGASVTPNTETQAVGTSVETQEDDAFMESLRQDIEKRRAKNDLLAEAAVEYRRQFGDDLSKYPEHVANYVRTQKELESEVPSTRAPTNNQLLPGLLPAYRTRPSHMNPEPYEGKNAQERIEYIQACQRVFDYSPNEYATDRSKIVWAATLLRKEPAKNWHRLRENHPEKLDTLTWKEYVSFLDNLLLQPDARRLLISKKYKEARQREKQSILSFINYLEELEAELEPYTDTQKRDNLFNKIRPELQKKLVDSGLASRQNTREDLITSISLTDSSYLNKPERREEKGKGRDKNQNHGNKPSYPRSSGPHSKWRKPLNKRGEERRSGRRASYSPKEGQHKKDKPFQRDNSEIICFGCNKPGHIVSDCPEKEERNSKRTRTATAVSKTEPSHARRKKLEIGVSVTSPKGKRATIALLDSGSDDDLIARPVARAFGFEVGNTPVGTIEGLNGDPGPIYGVVEAEIQATDSVGQAKSMKRQLFIVDMPGIDLILGMPWFEDVNPIINWAEKRWRYKYDFDFDIIQPRKLKKIRDSRVAYALMPELL